VINGDISRAETILLKGTSHQTSDAWQI